MKTFEEKMTAWIDGALSGKALSDFEHELARVANHEDERANAQKLGALLRTRGTTSPLANGDFFNHQIMERIARESREAANRQRRGWSWPLAKLSFAGAFSLCVAFALFHFFQIPIGPQTVPTASEYMAQVIDAQPGTVGVSATPLHSKTNDLTVLWLDGADYVPADTTPSAAASQP